MEEGACVIRSVPSSSSRSHQWSAVPMGSSGRPGSPRSAQPMPWPPPRTPPLRTPPPAASRPADSICWTRIGKHHSSKSALPASTPSLPTAKSRLAWHHRGWQPGHGPPILGRRSSDEDRYCVDGRRRGRFKAEAGECEIARRVASSASNPEIGRRVVSVPQERGAPRVQYPGQAWHREADRAGRSPGGDARRPLGSSAITPQGSCAGLVVAWVWDGAPYRRWRARDHRVRIDVV